MSPERDVATAVREVRRAYDALPLGDRAVLRRCRDAGDVMLEGVFWRLVRDVPRHMRRRFADIVACFPTSPERRSQVPPFRVGAFLRTRLYAGRRGDHNPARFRQLVQSRDRAELVHRLRTLLKHADTPVDWGVVGHDILFWGDAVRRRWVEDFFAPQQEEATHV